MEYYVAIKGNEALVYAMIWMSFDIAKWKQTDTKGCILYDSLYMEGPE